MGVPGEWPPTHIELGAQALAVLGLSLGHSRVFLKGPNTKYFRLMGHGISVAVLQLCTVAGMQLEICE